MPISPQCTSEERSQNKATPLPGSVRLMESLALGEVTPDMPIGQLWNKSRLSKSCGHPCVQLCLGTLQGILGKESPKQPGMRAQERNSRGEAEVRWIVTLTFRAMSTLQEVACIVPCQPLWSIHLSKFPLLLSLCCAVNMKNLSWVLPPLGAEAGTIHRFTDE